MNIQNKNHINFNGYDARPLKGFLMSGNPYGITNEMKAIAKKEGFKIFSVTGDNFSANCSTADMPVTKVTNGIWAQDLWTVRNGKILALEVSRKTKAIQEKFNLKFDFTQYVAKTTPKVKALNQELWNLFASISEPSANTSQKTIEKLSEKFDKKKTEMNRLQHSLHISGGNIFIVKGKKGDEVFVGEKELEKFSIDEIKAMYSVKKVTPIPAMDYHLDLFMRPLDNKRILLADDKLTLDVLNNGLEKFIEYMPKVPPQELKKYEQALETFGNVIWHFKKIFEQNQNPNADKVEKILQARGFEVIRVPARIYDITDSVTPEPNLLRHHCNFINANVLKNKDGDLVYITNKSLINEKIGLSDDICQNIGFDFEDEFVKYILPYVKNEHIYFIKGQNDFVAKEMLTEYQGGIHCASSEIPLK